MKKAALVAVIAALAVAVSMTLVYAQGPGYGRTGQPCPNGYTQPNPNATGPGQGAGYVRQGLPCPYSNVPQAANVGPGRGQGAGYGRIGQPCPYGYTQPNPNAGGWWTTVQPTTPEQKAFVDKATDLHKQIRDKQFELANLRAQNGDANKIAALEKDVQNLRNQLYDVMYQNRELRQQMGPAGLGGRGGRGKGYAAGNCWQQGGPGAWQNGNTYNYGGQFGRRGGRGAGQGRMMGAGPYAPVR